MKLLFLLVSFSVLSFAQAAQFSGSSGLKGNTQTSATTQTQNVHIYVVFPPASNPTGGKNNDNFRQYVMTQFAIDGVTVKVDWNSVEVSHSSGSCGANSDTCQEDSFSQFHTYNWSTADGTDCADSTHPGTGLGQWFCTKMWSPAKKVNPLIFGISTNPNTSTPAYVFTQAWADTLTTSLQDVINKNKDSCSSYSGYVPASMSMAADGTVTANMSGSMPFQNADTIWVGGAESTPHDYNTPAGTTVVYSGSGLTFTYQSTCHSLCTDVSASPVGSIVSSASSWPIPNELPYEVAFRAFVAAAVYHFSHTNTGTGGVINSDQVAYMRVGYSRGAEALPQCLSNWPGGAGTKQNWLNFYADMSSYIMGLAANAPFQIQTSINEAGSPIDPDFGTQEAGLSVEFYGGNKRPFGFGAQGLQISDKTNYSNCASDWCTRFETFWRGGSVYKDTDLELQQIDCSDPTLPAATTLQCAINYSATTGLGSSATGDLRILLPFATSEHMTILELYNQDALLAYDPKFCSPSSASCSTSSGSCTGTSGDVFSTLDTGHQSQFYECVGQGATCSSGAGSGDGDCSYKASIDAVHGVH